MKRNVAIGVFFLITIYLGARLGQAFRRSARPFWEMEPIRLSIPADALNMGTIWEDDHFAWTMPIENQEAVPVEIASFSTTCNCLSIEPKSLVLEPGERRDLHVQIDLIKQTKPSGEVSVALYPQVKAEPGTELAKRRPPQWTVKGQVRRVLTFERSVYLGRHSELSQPLPQREIPIEVLAPLESLSVECSLPTFTGSVKLPSNGSGKAVLRLAQSTSLPLGTFQGTLIFKPVRRGGKSLPARRLPIIGTIVPDVESVPPTVQVGGRRVGETFEEVVHLRSMTGHAVGAVRVETDGEGLSVEAVKESAGYRIRQKVCRKGSGTSRARFFTESAKQAVTITVPVSYTGIEAE